MTAFLASVQSIDEAAIALECDVDMIDLKNPHEGALGALPCDQVKHIVEYVNGRKTVSATIGDLPMQPALLSDSVLAMAKTGVDIVKVGFFGNQPLDICLNALGQLRHSIRLVAVLFADIGFDSSLIKQLAQAGFHGVMLDTAMKNGKSLTDICTTNQLKAFVDQAHDFSLLTGLAGSLKSHDIPVLDEYRPDYLGFRGALCANAVRTVALDRDLVRMVRQLLHQCHDKEYRMAVPS